jgi:ABC-2 type transport system permease protein
MLLHELRYQQLMFWRSRELAFFTFLLPILFLVLLGSVYGNDTIDGVKGSAYLLAGMLGYGLASTAFAGLSIALVVDREAGVLKRVRATPLRAWEYIAALLGSHLVAYVIEVVLLVGLARLLFGVPVPDRIFSLALLILLGALAFSGLGLAVTSLVRSAQGSSAVVNAFYLPMTFISGSFFSSQSFPRFLRVIAEVLPLTYFIRLARDITLRGYEIWDRPGWVGVVVAWGAAGAVVAIRNFRWSPREG